MSGAEEFVPASRSLRTLAGAVQECRGCPLWADATQAVFGRGPRKAELMLVGEQPGDKEDLEGEPFVGPAGRELRAALELAGTAARALFGAKVKVTKDRGRLIESELASAAAVTIHPSAILRLREQGEREEGRDGLVEDLRFVAAEMAKAESR